MVWIGGSNFCCIIKCLTALFVCHNFFGRSIFLFPTFLVIFFIALNWIFISIFICNSFFTSCFYLFCTFLIPQVLKPLGDNLMEENIRQSVTNSIKAGLTDQVSHHARLKTDWQFISSWTPLSLFFMLAVQWELNKNKPKFTINCRSSLV